MIFNLFKNNKIPQWNSNKRFPQDNQKIVFLTSDKDVYSGVFEINNKQVTMYEFLGMPFYDWQDVVCWIDLEDFQKYLAMR